VTLVSVRRRALKDFVLSDGTRVERGDWTLTPFQAINYDESIYPDAMQFDGFRFAAVETSKIKVYGSQPREPSNFIDPSETWHFWGSGRMTCPGRFYSATAMKLVMAHILQNYDVELVDEKAPRSWIWRTTQTPHEDASVIFRPRGRCVI
jgi:cytochrome P450